MKAITLHTIVVALCATIALSVSMLCYAGAAYYVNTLEARLYETKVNTKRAEDERRQLDALQALVADTDADRTRLASYIVSHEGVINFLAEVEGVAKRLNVVPETRTIATAAIPNTNLFEGLVVTMNLTGELDAIKRTIRHIEALPYQLGIEQGSIRSIDSDSANADIIIIATKRLP
jgi:uncharacterized membrane protein